MFSESWHHVANERIRLRPSLQIRKQVFRGERWYVLHDPFSNRFVRFRPGAYEFIGRLDQSRTVDEVWRATVELDPDNAPGQQEVIQLLAQLHQASLIQSNVSPDSAKLFERQRKVKRRELMGKFTSILFIRIPLWDPESFLRRTAPFVLPFFSKAAAVLWLVVVGFGLWAVGSNWNAAVDRVEGILAPGNIPLLFVSFFVIKFIHELGHAYAVKKFGGEVHTMGIMLLVFSPVPYVDATAAWAFRERWKRIFVSANGMVVELFLAAIAAVVWSQTGDGLVHSLAYNAMFVASVTTILFNINPLLRFDGYYILSDLTDTPNLHQRSVRRLYYLAERYLFGVERASDPSRSRGEGIWLAVFGIAAWCYRMFIFSVIILFVADKYFGLGLIAAVLGLLGLFVIPAGKFVRYLVSSPRLAAVRPRAVGVVAGVVAVLVVLLGVVPFPDRFRAPGVLLAAERAAVTAGVDGLVVGTPVPSATVVAAGDALVEMENKELPMQESAAVAELARVEALGALALNRSASSIEPVRKMRSAAEARIEQLTRDRDALTTRAAINGLWVSPMLGEFDGVWVARGTEIGEVIDPGKFEFSAVVSPRDATRFFEDHVRGGTVRFPGQAGVQYDISGFRIVPAQQERLPSAALGWLSGGAVEVAPDDPSGTQAAEPFFLVVADVVPTTDDGEASNGLLHRRTGVIRFSLPPKPLLVQWTLSFRQLLQDRFQI